ncbi:HNH endonuclease [Streptomyces sp. NPDC090126]|uniref:HNH endonuclease n=1 Tax=Streptomyces sp. NPDC090126 TaxID=3365952 RepID=UPI00380E0FC7
MVLTSHQGACVFCETAVAETIDHQEPVASGGADIWWNYLPACNSCNLRKNGKSALDWAVDMQMAYMQPRAYGKMKKLPLSVCAGIKGRVSATHAEIRELARREWFRHHYGNQSRPRNKSEVLALVAACQEKLATYPYVPWKSPNLAEHPFDACTRRICCGHKHPDWDLIEVYLDKKERAALGQHAFKLGIHRGDLAATILRQFLRNNLADPPHDLGEKFEHAG